MATDTITGVIIRDGVVEWATLARGAVTDSGTAALPVADPETGPESADQPPVQVGGEIATVPPATEPEVEASSLSLKGRVVLGLSLDRMLLRVVDLPAVDEEELASMIELQADKLSPFPTGRAVVSHELLHRDETGCRVLVALAEEGVVRTDGDRLEELGLVSSSVDSAVLGHYEWLQSEGHVAAEGRHILLIVDGKLPVLIVAEDGLPIAFRALGRRTDETSAEFVDQVVREIAHTLMSLELERGGAAVNRVSVWHEGSEAQALVEAVRRDCGCDVGLEDPRRLPPGAEAVARRALRKGRLDLTPTAWIEDRNRRSFRRKILRVASILAGIWLLGTGAIFGGIAYEERKLAQLEQKRDAIAGPAVEVRQLRRRVFMLKQYANRNDSALECLREVSLTLPVGVDVTWFTYRKGESLKLKGAAESSDQILDFKTKLDASELFGEVTLSSISREKRSGKEVFEMSIALDGGAS
jgi:Tfp pilus assembly protein PilN